MGAGGQWAAGEGVVDGAHGFRVVKKNEWFQSVHIFLSAMLCFQCEKNSDAYST
jgi:hypothetical protein